MSDLKEKFQEQEQRLQAITAKLNLEQKKKQAADLEIQTSRPDFWRDREAAQQVLQQLAGDNEIIDQTANLTARIQQAVELTDIATQQDQAFLDKEHQQIEKELKQLETSTYLSGSYDQSPAIVSLHAGQGGTEAMDWTEILFRMYTRYVEKRGWKWLLVAESRGEEAGLKSVTFQVNAPAAYGYLRREAGTHRLVRQSPFNADNLRQTSFSLVEVLPLLTEVKEINLDPKDLEVQFFRSSSQGGQNVQKVSTAVRLKHKPSGITVECQTQRYQEQNRKLAEQLLKAKLWQQAEQAKQAKIDQLKGSHRSAGWGTQIRSYVLHPYKLVKDLRTGYEENNPDSVLDGNLDGFVEAELSLLA